MEAATADGRCAGLLVINLLHSRGFQAIQAGRTSSRSSRTWAAGGVHAAGRWARQNRIISAASSLSVLFRASSICPWTFTRNGLTMLIYRPTV